jgi:hypothetical protein
VQDSSAAADDEEQHNSIHGSDDESVASSLTDADDAGERGAFDEQGAVASNAALSDEDSHDRASAFMQAGPPPSPPHVSQAPLPEQVPMASAPGPGGNVKPPTLAQIRRDKAKDKATELAATKDKVMAAVAANSSTSVNTSPRGTFDATYVAVNQAKIEGLVRVENMRATSQKLIANEELKLSTMKLQFAIDTAVSDRAARSIIQTEINVTALLNVDPTGATARLMMELVDARALRAAVSETNTLSSNIAAFAMSLSLTAAVPPVAVPAQPVASVVVAAPALVELIVLDSMSQARAR